MKNILITGANRGLGLEFVKQFQNRNNTIIATSRHDKNCVELKKIKDVKLLQLDLLSDQSIDHFVKNIGHEPIDLIINNAGIFHDEQFKNDLDSTLWQEEILINAISPIILTRKLKKNILSGIDKKIVFISSQMGSIDDNYSGSNYFYRSSKAALNAAAKSLAIDWKNDNLAVLMLHPGWVKTDMGGDEAKLSISESVQQMITIINNFSIEQTGSFLNYAGEKLEW